MFFFLAHFCLQTSLQTSLQFGKHDGRFFVGARVKDRVSLLKSSNDCFHAHYCLQTSLQKGIFLITFGKYDGRFLGGCRGQIQGFII